MTLLQTLVAAGPSGLHWFTAEQLGGWADIVQMCDEGLAARDVREEFPGARRRLFYVATEKGRTEAAKEGMA